MHSAAKLTAMGLVMAAIRTGCDPQGKLPEGSFHTTLPEQLICPKCDATYNVVVDYAASTGRFFERESAPLLRMLRKAVAMGHRDGHRVQHFETAGVVVKSLGVVEETPAAQPSAAQERPPLRIYKGSSMLQ